MKINLIEMEGLLRGQCIPGDLLVNETLAEYLVRQFAKLNEQLSESRRELTAANATIHNLELKVAAVVAENAGLKVKGREVLKESAYVYSHYNRMVDHLDGESIDGQTLHEFQFVLDVETPATDAAIANIRAQGVEMFADNTEREANGYGMDSHDWRQRMKVRADAIEFAAQLRQGADHE